MSNDSSSDLKIRIITATFIISIIGAVLYLGVELNSPFPLLILGMVLILAAIRELAVATFCSQSILTESIVDGPTEADSESSKRLSASLAIKEPEDDQPSEHYLGLVRSAFLLILILLPLTVLYDYLRCSRCATSLTHRLTAITPITLILIIFLACIAGRRRLSFGARTLISGMVGVTLLGLGGSQMLMLASAPWMLLKLIIAVAVNDSLAYFVGRAVGGMRLAPAISPKKTFSGSVAGLIGGASAGLALDGWDFSNAWVWIALILSAQMADLAKSLIKREFLIKDFGSTLPGHGGVFDRIDGVLGASVALLLILGTY